MIGKPLIERYSLLIGAAVAFAVTILYDLLKALPPMHGLVSDYPRDWQETMLTILAGAMTLLALIVIIQYLIKQIKKAPTILSEIVFDKERYSPRDTIVVRVVAPEANKDPDRQESIIAVASSSKQLLIVVPL